MFENPVAAIIFFSVIGTVILGLILLGIYHWRHILFNGYMRVIFVGEDRRIAGALIKADESDRSFDLKVFGKEHTYSLDRDRIYRVGRWRIPTAYYVFGNSVPIDLLQTGKESEVSAIEFAQVAGNTVTRDLLSAFLPEFLNPQAIFFLTIGVVVLGFVIFGVFTNQKFNEVEKLFPTPTPATQPGRNFEIE